MRRAGGGGVVRRSSRESDSRRRASRGSVLSGMEVTGTGQGRVGGQTDVDDADDEDESESVQGSEDGRTGNRTRDNNNRRGRRRSSSSSGSVVGGRKATTQTHTFSFGNGSWNPQESSSSAKESGTAKSASRAERKRQGSGVGVGGGGDERGRGRTMRKSASRGSSTSTSSSSSSSSSSSPSVSTSSNTSSASVGSLSLASAVAGRAGGGGGGPTKPRGKSTTTTSNAGRGRRRSGDSSSGRTSMEDDIRSKAARVGDSVRGGANSRQGGPKGGVRGGSGASASARTAGKPKAWKTGQALMAQLAAMEENGELDDGGSGMLVGRRRSMFRKPVLVFQVDGVLADAFHTSFWSGEGQKLYIRPGAVQGLHKLARYYQVCLVSTRPRAQLLLPLLRVLKEQDVAVDGAFASEELTQEEQGIEVGQMTVLRPVYAHFGLAAEDVVRRVLLVAAHNLSYEEIHARTGEDLVAERNTLKERQVWYTGMVGAPLLTHHPDVFCTRMRYAVPARKSEGQGKGTMSNSSSGGRGEDGEEEDEENDGRKAQAEESEEGKKGEEGEGKDGGHDDDDADDDDEVMVVEKAALGEYARLVDGYSQQQSSSGKWRGSSGGGDKRVHCMSVPCVSLLVPNARAQEQMMAIHMREVVSTVIEMDIAGNGNWLRSYSQVMRGDIKRVSLTSPMDTLPCTVTNSTSNSVTALEHRFIVMDALEVDEVGETKSPLVQLEPVKDVKLEGKGTQQQPIYHMAAKRQSH